MKCPACGTGMGQTVLQRDAVPTLQNRVWPTAEQARRAPCGTLRICWCPSCDHLWNGAFDQDLLRYDDAYDNRQDISPAFEAYLEERITDLRGFVSPGQTVVEVGCGQGDFLRRLCAATDTLGEGFDPAYRGAGTEGSATVTTALYGAEQAHVQADLVVCRHVIEHVPRPARLLRDVRAALKHRPAARVVFECPDVRWILDGHVLWDFFYEHVHYFSPRSLRAAFVRAGFRVAEHEAVFDGQYQWLVARPTHQQQLFLQGYGQLGEAVSTLQDSLDAWTGEIREALATYRADGPVALWGAGAKGATLAQIADPDASVLCGVVDLNPAKQGRYIGGTGHAVLAPADLARLGVAHVLVMNPAYEAEIRAQVAREGLGVRVHLAQPPRSAACSPSSRSASPPGTEPGTSSAA